jgi:membrane protease YdiL (CAAX protease family)
MLAGLLMTGRTDSRWEIAFVLVTGLGNILLAEWLNLQLVYVVAACLFWTGFVAVRATADRSVLTEWGFTKRRFGRSIVLLSPFMLLSVLGSAAYGKFTGSIVLHWHMVLVLLLYPVWGLVQQYLVVALIAGNIRKYSRFPEPVIVLLTAFAFALAHASSPLLVGASFCLALITTSVYFRTRNLWALGIFHGLFGTCLYFFVLGRDPLLEIIHGHG